MTRRLLAIAWLVLAWMALWESPTWARLVGGVAAAGFAAVLLPPSTPSVRIRFRPHAAVALAAYFGWKLVEASLIVAWEVVTPRDRTRPGAIAVQLRTLDRGVVTAVANMVSLTPGTLTLDADAATGTLYIHVLHLHSVEATTREVLHLEHFLLNAFPHTSRATGHTGRQP